MQIDKEFLILKQRPVLRAVLSFVAGALLFLAIIQSLTVTVAWWRNELSDLQAGDWLWILLFPILIAIYLRYFSIFRPDCRACLPDVHHTQRGPRAP